MKKANDSSQVWIKPRYLSIGIYGGLESDYETKTIIHARDENNYTWTEYRSNKELRSAVGAHLAFDWKYFGMDYSCLFSLENDAIEEPVVPGLGIRIGNKVYFTASVFDHPQSATNLAAIGMGFKNEKNQYWFGLTQGFPTTFLTYRFQHQFKLGTLGLGLQTAPWGASGFDYGLSVNFQNRLPF